MRRKVKVLLRGGLGNQLFQYFTGLEIVNQLGGTLVLDTSLLPKSTFLDSRGLSVFQDAIAFEHLGEKKKGLLYRILPPRLAHYIYTRAAQLDRMLSGTRAHRIFRSGTLARDEIVTMADATRVKGNLTVNSLCLSVDPKLDLRREQVMSLRHPKNQTSWFSEERTLLNSEAPVAIHIRLGDHLRHGLGFDNWYLERVLTWVEAEHPHKPKWVYSDEPMRAADLLETTNREFRMVSPPEESEPIESLALMSMAPVLVLARSTFSYWAGRVSSLSGNTVLANRQWLEETHPPIFLNDTPENWKWI